MKTRPKTAHYHLRNSEYGTGTDINLKQIDNSFSALFKMGIGALIGYYLHRLSKSGQLK